jgi:hypothetical protein
VNLIEDDPFNLSDDLTAAIDHIPQDLCSHHQACSALVDGDITSHQSYIAEFLFEFSVLLIGECFDGRCVDDSTVIFQGECDRVFGDGCFTS